MTAAKVMHVIARFPDCDGQAADAVSACTQLKLEGAPRLLKIPSSNVQTYGHVFHDTSGQNHWKNGRSRERFRFFLELISRFEFRHCDFF